LRIVEFCLVTICQVCMKSKSITFKKIAYEALAGGSEMGFMGKVTRASLRVGLLAAAVKISVDNDVWSLRTDDSSATYEKFKRNIVPGTIVYKKTLPSTDEVREDVRQEWNSVVNCAFSYIGQLPSRLRSTEELKGK